MPDNGSPDLLATVREQIDARLTELRPAVEEHEQLEAALTALNPPNLPSRRGRRGRPMNDESPDRGGRGK